MGTAKLVPMALLFYALTSPEQVRVLAKAPERTRTRGRTSINAAAA